MDGSHYSSNVNNNASTSYHGSESSTPQGLQHSNHTLPPLQHNNSVMQQQNYSGYATHTPRTPGTPNTPGSANNMGSYPPVPTSGAGRGYQMMPTAYQQSYTSASLMPQASTAMSHPQPIAPAPSPGSRGPPILRPMPPSGVMPQPGMSSPYAQSPLMQQTSMLPDGEQPTHVVGSQGRRGILPSAPGRPAAAPAGTASVKNQIPQKDADGKFPCPHCNKTYLHAKHLKRHLLRHTGDRPYMCVLCRDTFSRSDILKRHFQKCSIRRGNPTGASHLSHPHAHVKKSQAAQKAMNEGDLNHMNGMGDMPTAGMVQPFGLMPTPDGIANVANDQSQLSRSSSMNRLEEAANDRDRRSGPGSAIGASTRGGSFDQPYNGSVPPNINPQIANYNMTTGQNGLPIFAGQNTNQQANMDWSSMFQATGAQNDTYVKSFTPNIGQAQIGIKQEPNIATATANGAPSGAHDDRIDRSLFFSGWGAPPSRDPYQQLSERILNFFTPDYHVSSHLTGMDLYLSPANVKDFLEKYTHFHVHFSILHIPTFRILEANTGLLAGMCCIGACYSDQVSPDNVRDMMNFLKGALERDSQMLASLTSGGLNGKFKQQGNLASSTSDIEELQAIVLMTILFVWNGTPHQREQARQLFPLVALLAQTAGLLTVSKDSASISPLHQPDFSLDDFDISCFNWASWVQQEKRNRIMFTIFSFDVALGLYFNSPPLFDAFAVQLPLPADDAAWDAQDPTECAQALGLYGIEVARERNPDGTQRAKQPEMHLALQALLHRSYQMQTGTTNLYGKFILIHALLGLIRKAQTEGPAAIMNGTSSMPLAQTDWVIGDGQDAASPHGSANNSGRATPVDGMIPSQVLKAFITALDKFKRNWDTDMANQFLPSSTNPRRHGFSRDGVHYYWLANYLLKNTRPSDLQLAPDQRFTQVIRLLKSVKSWVMTDGATRGEELGSIGEIDQDYGAQNLTLDMVSLFKPLPKVVQSPGISSVKTEIGTGNGVL